MGNPRLSVQHRVSYWLKLHANGNQSDEPVDRQGNLLSQADCASELGVSRSSVCYAFQALKAWGFVRLEGSRIIVQDAPGAGGGPAAPAPPDPKAGLRSYRESFLASNQEIARIRADALAQREEANARLKQIEYQILTA